MPLRYSLTQEEREGQDWLHNAPWQFLACRIRHEWPDIVPGPLPPGVESIPQRDGAFQITLSCSRSGCQKIETTHAGGVYDADIDRKYDHPDGYNAPRGASITPTMCKTELLRRHIEWQEKQNAQ